ncbi:MAG: glycosyltransferase, partial [Anaerolineae bacterium]
VNIQYQAAAYNMRSPAINFLPWRLKGMTKTAVTFHDLRIPYLFPKAGRLRRTAVNFMARQAHGIIVTNREDHQLLMANGQLSIANIPIGSNIRTHERDEERVTAVRQQLGLAVGDCLLGYFGFLNESKGADTLVAALARLPERFHLAFIGGQTGASDSANNRAYLAELKSQITAAGLDGRVHWTGFVDDEVVSAYLHAADLMVMPYRDGASLRRGTLMAVLAHGRPLITTAPTIPATELIHAQNVWLIPPDDSTVLATAIEQVSVDNQLLQKLGAGAAESAGVFTWEKVAEKTAVYLKDLLVV